MDAESARNICFKRIGDRKLEMLFFPPAQRLGAAPVFFCIHGGGWHGSSKEEAAGATPLVFEEAAGRGIASVSIEYRLIGEAGVTMKEILEDCMDAARYLSLHAEELSVDPMRMVSCGHSAGGQLSMMLAFLSPEDYPGDPSLSGQPFRFTGCVNMNGPSVMHPDTDTVKVWRGRPVVGYRRVLPRSFEEDPEAYIRISPLHRIRRDSPPVLCIASRQDEVIPWSHSEILCRRGAELGVPCRLVTVENALHGYQSTGGELSLGDRERQQLIVDFITKQTASGRLPSDKR